MRIFRKSSVSRDEYWNDQHRFEHWYRDNSIYFITARCRDRFPAFASEAAKQIFWERTDHYSKIYGFHPWVESLMNNHYHRLGHLEVGENLGPMMQKIHGSVAKMVNDHLPERRIPFWYDSGRQSYFDGCIRDELQALRAARYTLLQAVRCGIVSDWRAYPHTRLHVELDDAIRSARERNAYMLGVEYARYTRNRRER